MSAWQEVYRGGSAEAERKEFGALIELMLEAQLKSQKAAKAGAVDRAFHVKSIAAADGATLAFRDDLPADLQVGFARPGASYPATFRFSNAASALKSDADKDMRGLAVRIHAADDEHHDLLATNFPVPHARDAHQFVVFAHAMAGGTLSRIGGIVSLIFKLGPGETFRMLGNIRKALRTCESLALETYWSRGAMRWGDAAVRYFFRPAEGAPPADGEAKAPNALIADFAARQKAGDIVFELCVQRFVDEKTTPIEDAATEWDTEKSPPIVVATLTLPRRDLAEAAAQAERKRIDALGFNPWNTTDEFRPLGHLNRARKSVYDASLAHRKQHRWKAARPPLRNRILGGGVNACLRYVNRGRAWHRLPLLVSLLNLNTLRHDLRIWNLKDAEPREAPPTARKIPPEIRHEDRLARTYDGRANDLSDPMMGAVGAAFGRNMTPQPQSVADDPNPVTVCRELMDRKDFIPATILNLLAAAWIQFQVHDWVNHARFKLGERDVRIPIPDGYDAWKNTPDGAPEREMRIAGNRPFPGREDEFLFANATSHWWDGSEVYGSDAGKANELRHGAKLCLTEEGYLPTSIKGFEITGFNESWWLGLSIMHTLFAREHNVLCDELKRAYPGWSEERIYQTGRLVVSALIAKIHTVEWTPAILATEALDIGMNANWYGPKGWMTRLGIWLTDAHALKGIPATLPDHHAAPYALTEEFTTVYRMHPLIPDDYIFYDFDTGAERMRKGFLDIEGGKADDTLRDIGLRDSLYSFGVAHPGAITLHNFPRSLQNLQRDGEMIDLSVVDIVRTRARCVPRYNAFRQSMRMPPVRRWEDLTANPETNRIAKELYGDIDKVDTVVGLLGENPPTGFGFSDTAFRIFVLMASRRLQSDRFLTVDYRPEIYSPLGMDWIENTSMTDVILRHCPELASVIPRGASAFAPWRTVY